ncbi:MAG TPA: LuxR C-terminal-related transcriptional regulator [Streptosporangiaceae bacterium]|nr:LuxR C-terminal-related transcriptional regulator [Streptosporangiaceae bacterium]
MSQREAEVLQAVGRHLTNAQIASRLHISVRTVESHVSSLLRKFGAADRRELAALAPVTAARPAAADGGAPVPGLPPYRTSFIGRESERVAVLDALKESRVVSLVGPGGVGKTRLAAKTAETAGKEKEKYQLGVHFVDLGLVREPSFAQVVQLVAALVGVTDRGGDLDVALHEYLARGRSLLVMDNCEHVLDVVAEFTEKLLANCDGLSVLATSREKLAIAGERAVSILPLPHRRRDGCAAGSEAAALFMDRARAIDPELTPPPARVDEVCERLDGMPLAIELAAARCASLGVEGLLAGLNDHLRLLKGSRSAQERHRSLRAVIDWSHDLLDEDERAMFRRLGVFAGGFDLDAALAVSMGYGRGAVVDLIGRLTDKSLLVHGDGPAGSRWRTLETIRAYALDRLRLAEGGEEARVLAAHLDWAADTADDLERRLVAEAGAPWQDTFKAVVADLRSALDHARSLGTAAAGGPGPGGWRARVHRFARALGHLAYASGFVVEACEHYADAAGLASGYREAAADLRSAADAALAIGHNDAAFDWLCESAEQAKEAGDTSGQAIALAYAAIIADRFHLDFSEKKPNELLRELLAEAQDVCPPGDPVATAYITAAKAWTKLPNRAVPHPILSGEALTAARAANDPVLISGALDAVVNALDQQGRIVEAYRLIRERRELLGQLRWHDPRAGTEIVDTYHMIAAIAVTAGDLRGAIKAAKEAQQDEVAHRLPHVGASKLILPLVLQGGFDEAFATATDMWGAWQRAGCPPGDIMGPAVYGVILAHGLRGNEEGRSLWLTRAHELTRNKMGQMSDSLKPAVAFTEARICLHAGDIGAAMAAIGDYRPKPGGWYDLGYWHSLRPYAWAIAAEVAVVAGQPDAGSVLEAAEPAGQENKWAAACLARAQGRLTGDRAALERSVAGWEHIGAEFERACTLVLLDGERAEEGLAKLGELGCPPPA